MPIEVTRRLLTLHHAGFGEGALEKYPPGQLAGVLLYLMSRSEGGHWKSAHRGNSLVAYPTSRTILFWRRGTAMDHAHPAFYLSAE